MSRALMLFPYAMISWVIIIAGCNQSTVTPPSAAPPAAPSVPTAVAPAQTVPAPAQVAYAQLTRDLASKVRDLASMYRSFVGREATQDDLKESDRKLEQIEQTANKLLGAAAPSEAAARALEKGVVSELDAAIHECTAINSLPTDQLDSGLTRGHPMVAVNVARRTRLHLLQALYPETVDTASTAPDSTAQLNSEAGGDSGFSAGNSPTEMPRAGEKSGTSSEAETAAAKWVNVVDPPQSESLLAGEAIFEITVPGLSARGSHGSRNGAEAIALAHEQALQAGITFPRTAGS
ncbi:MAG: hypothetical protein KDA75_18515, partial [Planctomycetaceae bacterium]|nr:hypothetical protein [Planctomycetaceae bacterium]